MVEKNPASPDGIPEQYVMQPYDVKLDYLGKPWCTVPLEVGHNEIGDADAPDWAELADAGELFEAMGFRLPKAFLLQASAGLAAGHCQAKGMG